MKLRRLKFPRIPAVIVTGVLPGLVWKLDMTLPLTIQQELTVDALRALVALALSSSPRRRGTSGAGHRMPVRPE